MKTSFLLIITLFMYACGGSSTSSKEKDEHSYAKIIIDDSFKKLFKTSIDTYQSQFPKAKFIIYLPFLFQNILSKNTKKMIKKLKLLLFPENYLKERFFY